MPSAIELESKPSPIENDLRNSVERLISQLGGKTHVVLRLEHGGRETIQRSSLMDGTKSFLLATMRGDQLEFTLHISEEDESPYTEILCGQPGSLRGLQCHTYDGSVEVSLRQNFDSTTLTPLNPRPTRELNNFLNHNQEAPFGISKGLVETVEELLKNKPEELEITV